MLSYRPIEESLFNFATISNQMLLNFQIIGWNETNQARAIGSKTEHILGMLRWWYFKPDATDV